MTPDESYRMQKDEGENMPLTCRMTFAVDIAYLSKISVFVERWYITVIFVSMATVGSIFKRKEKDGGWAPN